MHQLDCGEGDHHDGGDGGGDDDDGGGDGDYDVGGDHHDGDDDDGNDGDGDDDDIKSGRLWQRRVAVLPGVVSRR